jgi:hypothetical protein
LYTYLIFRVFFVPGINPLAKAFKSGLIKILFYVGFGSRTGTKVSYDGQDIIDIKTSRTSRTPYITDIMEMA